MESNILIIFSKDPIVGQVKTRIGEKVGYSLARDIYLEMLRYTSEVIKQLNFQKVLFTPSGRKNFAWGQVRTYKQEGNDLGERMSKAFEDIFNHEVEKICLVGSDNFEISPEIIEEAYQKLDHYDVVIGPSRDGGYYLIGLKQPFIPLFKGIEWSTDRVLKTTLKILKQAGKSVFLLSELRDCDEIGDIPEPILKRFVVSI